MGARCVPRLSSLLVLCGLAALLCVASCPSGAAAAPSASASAASMRALATEQPMAVWAAASNALEAHEAAEAAGRLLVQLGSRASASASVSGPRFDAAWNSVRDTKNAMVKSVTDTAAEVNDWVWSQVDMAVDAVIAGGMGAMEAWESLQKAKAERRLEALELAGQGNSYMATVLKAKIAGLPMPTPNDHITVPTTATAAPIVVPAPAAAVAPPAASAPSQADANSIATGALMGSTAGMTAGMLRGGITNRSGAVAALAAMKAAGTAAPAAVPAVPAAAPKPVRKPLAGEGASCNDGPRHGVCTHVEFTPCASGQRRAKKCRMAPSPLVNCCLDKEVAGPPAAAAAGALQPGTAAPQLGAAAAPAPAPAKRIGAPPGGYPDPVVSPGRDWKSLGDVMAWAQNSLGADITKQINLQLKKTVEGMVLDDIPMDLSLGTHVDLKGITLRDFTLGSQLLSAPKEKLLSIVLTGLSGNVYLLWTLFQKVVRKHDGTGAVAFSGTNVAITVSLGTSKSGAAQLKIESLNVEIGKLDIKLASQRTLLTSLLNKVVAAAHKKIKKNVEDTLGTKISAMVNTIIAQYMASNAEVAQIAGKLIQGL